MIIIMVLEISKLRILTKWICRKMLGDIGKYRDILGDLERYSEISRNIGRYREISVDIVKIG